jgi:hypothetical protein
VAAVEELTTDEEGKPRGTATARTVAEKLGLDRSNAGRRLRMAADGGYVINQEDKRGKPARWGIGAPLPETVDLLPHPPQFATPDSRLDWTVAVLRRNLGDTVE